MWGLRQLRMFNVAAASAVVFVAGSAALAEKRPDSVKSSSAPAKDDSLGLAQRPMYELSPATMPNVDTHPPAVEPVLVPLPPGAWAALTGLVGLATVAAWRKYRFRHD